MNPLVGELLTCLERELDSPRGDDSFPERGGLGAMPCMPEDDLDAPEADGDNCVVGVAVRQDEPEPRGSWHARRRADVNAAGVTADDTVLLSPPIFTGAGASMYEPDAAAGEQRNGWYNQVRAWPLGFAQPAFTTRPRSQTRRYLSPRRRRRRTPSRRLRHPCPRRFPPLD